MEKLVPPGEPPTITDWCEAMFKPELRDDVPVLRDCVYDVSGAGCSIVQVVTGNCMPVKPPAFDCPRAIAAFVRVLRSMQPWSSVTYVYKDGRKVKIK